MLITASLAWFDEELGDLDRCIRSLPVVADRLVAVDGGYARFPGASPSSPKEQAALIREVCADIGLPVEVHVPGRIWAGQVEKRSFLLSKAAEGSDWIVGVDADHVLHGCRESIRDEIAALVEEDAVDVDYWTPINRDRPMAQSAAGEWHRNLAGKKAKITGIFRALPGLQVEDYHWWYSALKDERRYWIWGGDGRYPHAETHTLYAPFFVEHRCLFRQPKQIMANREFCRDREGLVRRNGREDPPDVDTVKPRTKAERRRAVAA